jgi:hypothetical protein
MVRVGEGSVKCGRKIAGRSSLLLVRSELAVSVNGSVSIWLKWPSGPPPSMQHFQSRGLSLKNLYLGAPDLAVVRDRIVFNPGDHTGNAWMTERPRVRD